MVQKGGGGGLSFFTKSKKNQFFTPPLSDTVDYHWQITLLNHDTFSPQPEPPPAGIIDINPDKKAQMIRWCFFLTSLMAPFWIEKVPLYFSFWQLCRQNYFCRVHLFLLSPNFILFLSETISEAVAIEVLEAQGLCNMNRKPHKTLPKAKRPKAIECI